MRYRFIGGTSRPLGNRAMLAAATVAASSAFAAPALAAGTLAGTDITNVATASYDLPSGGSASIDSNTVTLKVDELLDVTVAWADPADVSSAPGVTSQVLTFTVTNGGNGKEKFILGTVANGGGDDFDPTVTSVVLDSNGNNAYDAGVDTVYSAGSNDPELNPDQSLSVFVISSIPSTAQDANRGRVDLTAVAVTGSGAPGSSFAGAGEGGGNAVVGASGADGQHDGYYRVARASVTFVKSATVADPFGGTTQTPGSIVTYTLTTTVSGSGSISNVRVSDGVPTGATYTANSITLDGSGLTDADDADQGKFNGSGINVSLGNLAAGTTKIVTFKVKID